jgi:hypothetical protein
MRRRYGWLEVCAVKFPGLKPFEQYRMSLTTSLTNAIDSATYNPAAVKAREEAQKRAVAARETYRSYLKRLEDVDAKKYPSKVGKGYETPPLPSLVLFGNTQITNLVQSGRKWLDEKPNAAVQEIAAQQQTTVETVEKIPGLQQVLGEKGIALMLKVLPDLLKDTQYLKTTPPETVTVNKKTVETVSAFLKKNPNLTVPKAQELQTILEAAKKEGFVFDTARFQQEEATLVAQKQKEEAERQEFKVGRFLKETMSITTKVVLTCFLIVLMLVSGMLCANDAIGREIQYRVLYFFYGALGFVFVLPYYVYRWLSGTAPKIYRLLPLFTAVSETSLGRFLWYPFTYVEDSVASKAQTQFLEKAAKMVGGQVAVATVSAATVSTTLPKLSIPKTELETVSKVTNALQKLSIGPTLTPKNSLSSVTNAIHTLSIQQPV